MYNEFEHRIHTAAITGWWTLAIAAGIFLAQWVAYLLIVPAKPSWLLKMWGPGADWTQVKIWWFWGLAGFKVLLAIWAILLVWLTLWARELRKSKPTG
jgi:hypothetical protein